MEVCRYDPVREWDRYCEVEEQKVLQYPICKECGERILDEWCYRFGSEYICENCILDHKVLTPEED